MATQEEINAFTDALDVCLSYEPENLMHNTEWGKINFEGGKDDFVRLYSLANSFKTLPLDILPDGQLNEFANSLKAVNSALSNIANFSIEQQTPTNVRDSYLKQLKAQVNDFFTKTHIYIPYLAYQRGDVDRNIASLNSVITKAKEDTDQAKKEVLERRKEIDLIVAAAREASVTAGVAHFAEDFAQSAKDEKASATFWIKWTAFLAGLTLVTAIGLSVLCIFWNYPPEKQWQLIASKVLIVLILATATLWCGRMFKSSRHLQAINKHRADALKTFQAFIQSTEDEPTRNAVLIETTRSIFAIAPTGLIGAQDSGDSGGLKVLEIIKQLGNSKPG